jgi:hypothetical protein
MGYLIGTILFASTAYALYPEGVFSIPFAQLTLGDILRLLGAVVSALGAIICGFGTVMAFLKNYESS